jgi:glutamate carboxypeptidase
MNASKGKMLAWLDGQEAAMLQLLHEIVDIDSSSRDKAGVDAVGARFARLFADEGIAVQTIPVQAAGDVLRARIGAGAARPVVLLGHRDTVFPPGETQRRPFRIDGTRAYGPGVCDMKGGLVLNAYALIARKRHYGNRLPVEVAMTGDEEIGSPHSRDWIRSIAREAAAVFNSEPARPNGNLVNGRRGGGVIVIDVYGKAAHSGGCFTDGISAIGEMANKIVALHALSDVAAGYTVNVGVVEGGEAHNTIAPHCQARMDFRFITKEQRDWLISRIEEIVATAFVPGTRAEMKIEADFLPMVRDQGSDRLLSAYQAAASEVGFSVDAEFTFGCADSGFTASEGCPTICATGPMGWEAHTPNEYLEIASLVPRTKALALAVLNLLETNADTEVADAAV